MNLSRCGNPERCKKKDLCWRYNTPTYDLVQVWEDFYDPFSDCDAFTETHPLRELPLTMFKGSLNHKHHWKFKENYLKEYKSETDSLSCLSKDDEANAWKRKVSQLSEERRQKIISTKKET